MGECNTSPILHFKIVIKVMKKDYENVNDFIEDVHNEIDLSELIIDMGIVKEKDFRGQFISEIGGYNIDLFSEW